MKNFKISAKSWLLLSASVFLMASCSSESAIEETTVNQKQMKIQEFDLVLKNLNSPENLTMLKGETLEQFNTRKVNSMVEGSRTLLISTGLSTSEIDQRFGNDNGSLVEAAVRIYIQAKNPTLKL